MKFAIIFLIFTLLIGPIFSQDLTAEQEREFNRLRLFAETSEHTLGSINLDTGFWYSSTMKYWKGYQGFGLISEENFYRIAGYDREADQAKAYRTTGTTLLITGSIVYFAGMGIMLYPVIADDYNNFDTYLWTGLTVAIVGAIPFGIGISYSLQNWGPAGLAFRIADDYNTGLKKRVRSK